MAKVSFPISLDQPNLSSEAKRLLELLVSKLLDLNPEDPRTCIRYKDAHDALGLKQKGSTFGESLKRQGLAALAEWTVSHRKPAITGMVIDGESLMPAEGYFKAFGKSRDDLLWWIEQLHLSKGFDWSPYVKGAVLQVIQTPTPIDIDIPSDRVETKTYRILRDTSIAVRIKSLHKSECQICGHTIVLRDGSRYAEAHHIRPLGSPHNGPDAIGNVICVCPNHHAELDYGVQPISLEKLRTVEGHAIELRHVQYHNDTIFGRKPI